MNEYGCHHNGCRSRVRWTGRDALPLCDEHYQLWLAYYRKTKTKRLVAKLWDTQTCN